MDSKRGMLAVPVAVLLGCCHQSTNVLSQSDICLCPGSKAVSHRTLLLLWYVQHGVLQCSAFCMGNADRELTTKQSANAPYYCSGMYLSAFQADNDFVLVAR